MTRRKARHDLDAFHSHLDALKLSFIREHYADIVRRATEEHWDHLSVLERLIEGEASLRRDRSIQRRIRLARFPVKKTLDSFDWSWPKIINRLQIQNLFRLRFFEEASNVMLVGGVGLGKSHLVTALGLRTCECGRAVLFTSAIDAVNTLAAAKAAGQLKRDLARLFAHIAPARQCGCFEARTFPPFTHRSAHNVRTRAVGKAWKSPPTIIFQITYTNRAYKHWPEIFNHDATLTSAVLDRLLHRAETVTLEGKSFRMKDVIGR